MAAILVVDDDKSIQGLVSTMLEAEGTVYLPPPMVQKRLPFTAATRVRSISWSPT